MQTSTVKILVISPVRKADRPAYALDAAPPACVALRVPCAVQGQNDDAGGDNASQADDSERALLALVGSIGRGLWYAGFLAVPAALFWAGVSIFDALHGGYLLLLLGGLLHYTLQLYPAVSRPSSGLTPLCREWNITHSLFKVADCWQGACTGLRNV